MLSPRRAAPRFTSPLPIIVLFLAAAGPLPARAQAPWHFAGVRFPTAIDTFVSQAAYRWPDNPAMGVSLTYVIPGTDQSELTIYVYPVRQEDTAAARGDATLERDRALNEVRTYALQYRQLDEFRVDTTDVVTLAVPGLGTLRGAYAQFFFRLGQRQLRSLLYVFVSGGDYVKFRVSFDLAAADALTPHLTSFLAGALASVRREQP
jgi:hypothetical protein